VHRLFLRFIGTLAVYQKIHRIPAMGLWKRELVACRCLVLGRHSSPCSPAFCLSLAKKASRSFVVEEGRFSAIAVSVLLHCL
jgi:hypothetical protein